MRGSLAEAERAAAELLAEGRATPDPHPGDGVPLPPGPDSTGTGQAHRGPAHKPRESALGHPGHRPSAYQAGLAHLGIAQVLYERDQLDDALQHLRKSSELGRHERWFRERERVALAWIHQAMGEADSALAAIDEACRLQASPEVSSLWYPAASERARLLLAQGQPAVGAP